MTLPTDGKARKRIPLYSGLLQYFPDALASVARRSVDGNDQHNAGQPLMDARWKSTDDADCILRHMMDLSTLLDEWDRPVPAGADVTGKDWIELQELILDEAAAIAWRALRLSQKLHERIAGQPMAPAARDS